MWLQWLFLIFFFLKLYGNLKVPFLTFNFVSVLSSYRNKHPKAETVSSFQDIPAVGAPTTKTLLVIPATDITPLARDKPILPIACKVFKTPMSFLQNVTLLQIIHKVRFYGRSPTLTPVTANQCFVLGGLYPYTFPTLCLTSDEKGSQLESQCKIHLYVTKYFCTFS